MNAGIRFTSFVDTDQRARLEALVFFNARQQRVLPGIVGAIERFGPPEIFEDAGKLRVRVAGEASAQSLFAVEHDTGRPLGIAVYLRSDFENISVLHLGIAAEFATDGPRSGEHLLFRLLHELRRSCRRVKGVRTLEVLYLSGKSGVRGRSGRR